MTARKTATHWISRKEIWIKSNIARERAARWIEKELAGRFSFDQRCSQPPLGSGHLLILRNSELTTDQLIAEHAAALAEADAVVEATGAVWPPAMARRLDAARDELLASNPASVEEQNAKIDYYLSCRSFAWWDDFARIDLIASLRLAGFGTEGRVHTRAEREELDLA
jgi:hypothetical protein